jgi:hypothetical protein
MKILQFIGIALLVSLLVMQVYKPERNLSAKTENDISVSYPVPDGVKTILSKACNDCHTNKTEYPWYANVQPIAWWLNDHVVDGKRHFNLNEFNKYRIARQYKKLEECIKEVKEGGMPLPSYTIMHKNAILTMDEKVALTNWCNALRDSIKAKYPADSLILPKRK